MTIYVGLRLRGPGVLRPISGLAASLSAVLSFAVALGPFFMPRDLASVWGEPALNIADCYISADGGQAILLSWSAGDVQKCGLQRRITVHELDESKAPRVLLSGDSELRAMSVSAADQRVFVGANSGSWYLIDRTSTGDLPPAAGRHPEGLEDLLCSYDGQTLVTRGESCLCAWNVASGTILWQRDDLSVRCWDLSPVGGILCDTCANELLELDLATGQTIRRVRPDRAGVFSLKVSPCGRYVVETAWDGTLQLLDYQTGRCLWRNHGVSTGMHMGSRVVAFSPCSRYLVTLHERELETLVVWNTADGHRLRELHGHAGRVVGATFHPAGTLYSWGCDRQLLAWNLESGPGSYVVSTAVTAVSLAAVEAGKGL
jgi:WD40 repeat protein